MSDDRLEALYVLAVHTGMREGELLGLEWEDVDLEAGVLRLRHALVREGGRVKLGDLKTPKSRRSVRLARAAADALRNHLERQLEGMERMGSLPQPGGLVFATESGNLINPSNLRNRSFKPSSIARGCQRSASTTFVTPAPLCCSPRAPIPSSSRSFSATPP